MPSRKRVLKGRNVSAKHSTFSREAALIIETAKKHTQVTNIVPGMIRRRGGGRRALKIRTLPAGLCVVVRGSDSVQDIWVYTSARDSVEQIIKEAWAEAGW